VVELKKLSRFLWAILALAAFAGEAAAATCTSLSAGRWDKPVRWDCGHVPVAGDWVVIAHDNVDMRGDYTIAGLTINAGARLVDAGNDLTVTGNVLINGTYDGSGNNGSLIMTGNGSTLSGTGTVIDIKRIQIDADVTIPAGANLNLTLDSEIRVGNNNPATLTIDGTITGTSQNNGNRIIRLDNNNTSNVIINGTLNAPNSFVEIQQGGTVTNNGTVALQYLDGNGDTGTTWTQGTNSSLTLSQPTQGWNGTFNASTNGNTVTFNGTAAPFDPATYYNIGGTNVTCPHPPSITVLGSTPCVTFPTVTSINAASANPTAPATIVAWTITFSASVTGVDATDFTLVQSGGVSGASITDVTVSGTTWTVTANTGSGTGTLGLNLVDNDSIVDASARKLGGTGAGNGNFTGQVYTVTIPALSGVINTYYPGTASVAAGATSITLGAATGATMPIAIGDMLLIMQIQDATIDSTNTATYGTVSAANAGKYEYAIAASNVPLGGGALTLSCGTTNAYTNANYVAGSSGQKRYQVIRVPSYANATLTSGLSASAWNGSTGGLLAFDVTGALALNSATVTVDGMGFRGGATRTLTGGAGVNTDYRTLATVNNNGSKGEGVAGTPYYVFTAPGTLTNTGVEGYPNGSHARGAPANGGGGCTDRHPAANDQNPGGGGGANGGAGGAGGIGWCPTFNAATPPLYGCGPNSGGLGGYPVAGLGSTRLTLGGGGGGGTTNNGTGTPTGGLATSGAAGGGIIMLRAGSMSGAATFNAKGSSGNNTVGNDGSGGGGAGGVVLIKAGSGMGGVTINVNGGNGGSNLIPPLSSRPHGPGGGGGGGYAITSGAPAAVSTAAGGNGVTYNNGVLFGAYGATGGSPGSSNSGLTSTVGVALGATACGPSGPDHYTISHSGSGITCEAEPVTFTAHDTSHTRAGADGKTISISTNTGSGTWLASADTCARECYDMAGTAQACVNGFSNTVGNNGTASYTFAAGESGIRLCLKQNIPLNQNINVSDGTASETTGTAGADSPSADPLLAFTDTGIRIYADGNVDTIASQIAGVRNDDAANYPSPTKTLTVRALKSGTTTPARCVPLLSSVTRTLQFSYRCESSPSTCSASLPQGLEVNGTAVSGFNASSTPVPVDNVSVVFDASGYGSINLKYFDVGNISLWAKAASLADSTTSSTFAVVTGNSNTFAVKPYSFEVIPCAAAVVGDCTVMPADPGLVGGGGVFAKAGEAFKVTATARAFGGSKAYSFGRCDSSGGTGCAAATESVGLSHTLAGPVGGTVGALGGTTSANASSFVVNSGAYTFTDLNWDEVGVIKLKASSANYLTNSLGTCTTETAGEKCQGTYGASSNLGRFIPDHFDVVVASANGVPMTCPTELTCPGNLLGATGFIYSGQPFSLQVSARNAGGSPTSNYQGVFAKKATLSAWDAIGSLVAQNPGGGAVTTGTVVASAFVSGIANATPTYTFGISPTAPTDIYMRAEDTDNTSSRRAALPSTSVEEVLKVVSGRAKVGNAYGSEKLGLSTVALVQYYGEVEPGVMDWMTSSTDGVTNLTLNLSNYQCKTNCPWTTAATPPGGPVGAGQLSFTLSAPTGAGTGSVDVGISGPSYLLTGSNGAGVDPSIAGTAVFGIYQGKGNRSIIYQREAY